ncbi:Glycolate dehydrogenase, subunit GlcD [Marinobacterium lacunae]|uniref:Glycolate dehydrogenase, subunit GlcD n=1 Tax=Marinobacterium lacunae TaxID=1232683 RepID=A0A081FTP9_9GAMM|nr:(Fe-S)-binding protein [Marinobacterium lacunae]KEA61904.1 Glycolate dehydrogenase, subunit GlcD [Marinobacterium lacunae]
MDTELDWSEYESAGLGDAYADIPKEGGDFAKAVSVCINSMVCLRPIERGVMCPSFRVHGDAMFSPGGRSRLLKRMLNGDISDDEQRLLDRAMAACVSCKGCKRECDTNLDIATIRVEYLAQKIQRSGVTLRQRAFAALPDLLHYPRVARFAVSAINSCALFRKWLSLSDDHPLPIPVKALSLVPKEQPDSAREVVLWVDSFTAAYAPEAASAALQVLEASGFRVFIVRGLCGGRSAYSQGLVAKARKDAVRLIKSLEAHIKAGRAVIGLEPSTLLMLRDELRALGLGTRVDELANNAYLFEEFLARELNGGRLKLPLRSASDEPPVMVHGHCHQKSVGAMKSMRKILKQVPGLEFEFIEASCCGGAGSFGFEVENAADARAMAELVLMPVLRARSESQLVANGFSCREQVARLGGPKGIHVAELLARYLA